MSEIQPAIPELTALALATRPGWTETAVTGAILAAKTAGWSWPRTLTRMARLAADPDAEPQQMLDELRDPLKRAAGTHRRRSMNGSPGYAPSYRNDPRRNGQCPG